MLLILGDNAPEPGGDVPNRRRLIADGGNYN